MTREQIYESLEAGQIVRLLCGEIGVIEELGDYRTGCGDARFCMVGGRSFCCGFDDGADVGEPWEVVEIIAGKDGKPFVYKPKPAVELGSALAPDYESKLYERYPEIIYQGFRIGKQVRCVFSFSIDAHMQNQDYTADNFNLCCKLFLEANQ